MRKSLTLLLSLLGLFASLYLLWVYASPWRPMACLGSGCDAVRSSEYSRLGGLPVPLYGVVAYSILALLLFAEALASARLARLIHYALGGITGAGWLFSIYLSYLEAFVIHAWCAWCVVSALVMTGLFALALSGLRQPAVPAEPGPVLARMRGQLVLTILALTLGIPAFYYLSRHSKLPPAPPPTAQTLREHLVRPDSHVMGNAGAAVTVVEFADFECPVCAQQEQVVEEVCARYPTQIRLIFRQFPLTEVHPQAEKAAEASECAAEQGRFWDSVAKFYTWQDDLREEALKNYARQLGLDLELFDKCLARGSMAGKVRRDLEDGLALGVRLTPTFYVGQKRVEGFLPVEAFTKLIEQELVNRSRSPNKAPTPQSNVP
jgi:protein-disulfide isomerase